MPSCLHSKHFYPLGHLHSPKLNNILTCVGNIYFSLHPLMGTYVASTLWLLQITRDIMVHISEPLLPILKYTPRRRIARSYGNSAPAPPLNLFLNSCPQSKHAHHLSFSASSYCQKAVACQVTNHDNILIADKV